MGGKMDKIDSHSEIIYGPIISRSLGKSLGINFSPSTKTCSFDCVYCQYGRAGAKHFLPSDLCGLALPEQISEALADKLKSGIKCDHITFSGNGEVTLHPQFKEIVRVVKNLRNRLAPDTKLVLLSNGSTLAWKGVLEALEWLDLPIIKLDAGDQETFQKINRPHSLVKFEDLIFNLKKAKGITVQTMLTGGTVENSSEDNLKSWLTRMKEIRPRAVRVCSFARPAEEGLRPVQKKKLDWVVTKLKEAGIKAEVY